MHRQRNKRRGELAHRSDYFDGCIGRKPASEKSRRIFERALRRIEEEEIDENKNHRNGKLSAGDSGDK